MEKLKVKLHDFVKSGEKHLKTDTIYLAKGTFWNVLNQIANTIISLGLAVAMGHLVPKELYGNYKYLISLASLVGAFSLTGLGTAVIQAVAKGYDGELREAFKLNLKWSFAVLLLSFSGAFYYFLNDNYILSWAFVFIGILTPFLNGASLYASFLSGKKEFRALAMYSFWRNAIPAAFVLVTVFITANPLVLVTIYLASSTAIAILLYFYSLKKYERNRRVDPETGRYGIHLSAMSIVNAIAEQIDKVVVFQHLGGTPLAVYSFATAIPLQIKGLFKNVYQLAVPKFAERPFSEIKSSMFQKMFVAGTTLFFIVTLYIVLTPLVFNLLFPKYMDSVLYSQVFAISLLPYVMIFPMAALQAHKAVKELYGANIYFSFIKILLVLIPVFFYGLWGIILGKIAYEFISLAIIVFYFKKYSARNP